MADEHQVHDSSRDHAQKPAHTTPTSATPDSSLSSPSFAATLLSHPAIGGRGNGPVRAAAIQRLQQSVGNRAVQRLLAGTPVVVQREDSDSDSDSEEEEEEEAKVKPKRKHESESENDSENDSEEEEEKEDKEKGYKSDSEEEERGSKSEEEDDFNPAEEEDGPEPPEEFDKQGRTSAYPTSWSPETKQWAAQEAKRLGLCPLCDETDLTAKIPIPGKRAQEKRDKNPKKAAAQQVGYRRGYDIDHRDPRWADRLAAIKELVFLGKLAQPSNDVLYRVYNSKLRVTCPGCNTSHAHEAKIKNFNIDDYDGKP